MFSGFFLRCSKREREGGLIKGFGGFTFKDPDCGGIVIDSASGSESGFDDGGGGDEIVCECVVEVSL